MRGAMESTSEFFPVSTAVGTKVSWFHQHVFHSRWHHRHHLESKGMDDLEKPLGK